MQMQSKKFFLSSLMVENVVITCIILSSKFYLETDSVVFNADIANFIKSR